MQHKPKLTIAINNPKPTTWAKKSKPLRHFHRARIIPQPKPEIALPTKLMSITVPRVSNELEIKFTRMKSAIAGADITIVKTSHGNLCCGLFATDESEAFAEFFPQKGHHGAEYSGGSSFWQFGQFI